MANNKIVVIYKEVGKKPELKGIESKLTAFQDLLGRELNFIPYEDITIVTRKDQKNLKSNIYLNTTLLNIRERNIKGNIILTCRKDGEFIPLTEEQAIRYRKLLSEESFAYNNLNKNGKEQ